MRTSTNKNSPAQEFFYEKNGKRADAALHEQILREGDSKAAFDVTRELLASMGWTPEQIAGFKFTTRS